MVPVCACSNFPFLCLCADVKAPFSCPNNSLSINSEGMAAQFTSTKGNSARLLFSCNQRATSSLPEPFGPVINTRASVGATFSIMSFTLEIASDSPTISYVFVT